MASGLLIRQIQRKAGAKGYQWRPGPPQPFRPKGIADGYFEDDNEGEDEMARIARLKLYDYNLDATERAGYGEFLANYNMKKSIAEKNGNFTKEFQKWLLGSSHLNDIVPWKHQSLEPVIPTIGQYLSKEIEEAFLVQYYLCRLFVLGPSNEIECEHYFRYLVYPVQKAYDTLVEAGLGGYDDGQPKDVGAKVLQICSTWYSRMTQGINVPEFPSKLIYANRIPGGYQLQVEGDGEYSCGAYEAEAPDNVMFDKAVNPYMRDRLEYDWVRLMKGESLTANHWARLLEYSRGKNFYLLNSDIESQRVEYSQQLLDAGGNEEGTLQPGDTRQINNTIPGAGKIIKEESNIQLQQDQVESLLETQIKQEPEEASGSASENEENSSDSEKSDGNAGVEDETMPQANPPAADASGVVVPAPEPSSSPAGDSNAPEPADGSDAVIPASEPNVQAIADAGMPLETVQQETQVATGSENSEPMDTHEEVKPTEPIVKTAGEHKPVPAAQPEQRALTAREKRAQTRQLRMLEDRQKKASETLRTMHPAPETWDEPRGKRTREMSEEDKKAYEEVLRHTEEQKRLLPKEDQLLIEGVMKHDDGMSVIKKDEKVLHSIKQHVKKGNRISSVPNGDFVHASFQEPMDWEAVGRNVTEALAKENKPLALEWLGGVPPAGPIRTMAEQEKAELQARHDAARAKNAEIEKRDKGLETASIQELGMVGMSPLEFGLSEETGSQKSLKALKKDVLHRIAKLKNVAQLDKSPEVAQQHQMLTNVVNELKRRIKK